MTFESDGNPNTDEFAIVNVGTENYGKHIKVLAHYYRNEASLNNPSYQSVVVSEDGTVTIADNTPMPKYPDECDLEVLYNGKTYSARFTLGTYKGSQTHNA